ncbi:MAG: Hpt domain-containing protein [Gammaproteobacteria bacterium]|nr:Hpt domain-containing protein [Gammaproteobacteria bacterium]
MSEIFNKQQALEQAGDDPDLAKDLLQMLFAELPDLLEKLKQALTDNNKTAIWDHTHKIHGSTAYCGVPALRAAAHSMEQLIRDELESEFIDGVGIIEREIGKLLSEGEAILAQFD